jgi:hypothetical protein
MTIKTNEFVTNETFGQLAFKLKTDTRQVKFGPMNAIPKNTARYPKPWVGEIDERGEWFKLFRQKKSDNTSDLSVNGKYIVRSGQPIVEVKHKLALMGVVGFAGLALFVFAAFYLLSKKGIVVHPVLQILVCVLALAIYGYTFYRDLREDEKQIRLLIYEKLYALDDEREEEEGGEEEDEENEKGIDQPEQEQPGRHT